MRVTPENTDFVALYAGLSQRELDALERLLQSIDENYDITLTVIDGSHDAHERVDAEAPLWTQNRNFAKTEGVDLRVTPEDSDELFSKYSDSVDRLEMCVFPRMSALDEVLYEYLDSTYCLFIHSDVEFINGNFFADVSDMTEGLDSSNFGALGLITTMMPLGVDQHGYGDRADTIVKSVVSALDSLREWLIKKRHEGFGSSPTNVDERGIRRKGQFPRLAPYLILLNREQYTNHRMQWNPLYLDVDDYTTEPPTDWRIIGDSGASLLYQMATHELKILNVEYSNWVRHEGGTWNPQLKRINWYYIGRDYEGTRQEYWENKQIPDELLYEPRE